MLLNLLIAVVIDSYNTIKDEKTEEVFWSCRLDFVTKVELIKNWFHANLPCVFCGPSVTTMESDRWDFVCGYEVEDYVRDDDKIWELFLATGLLWPPAVRKRLWDRRISKDENSMK